MKINRSVEEYWTLSPAQVAHIIDQHAEGKQRRGNAQDLQSMVPQKKTQ